MRFLADLLRWLWQSLRMRFRQPTMSLIGDGIYQGGFFRRVPPGIEAVLDLADAQDVLDRADLNAFAWLPIPDGPAAPSLDWLELATRYLEAWVANGWTVLVHCREGVSRSGFVDVAYWMRAHHWTRDEALAFVRQRRPETAPNPWFMLRLGEWERRLQARG